jgi:hypothetical protein
MPRGINGTNAVRIVVSWPPWMVPVLVKMLVLPHDLAVELGDACENVEGELLAGRRIAEPRIEDRSPYDLKRCACVQ